MRIGWKSIVAVVAGLPVAGFLVIQLGLIDVRASTGHWQVTDWFLHWVMRSSVTAAAGSTEAPPLDDPGLLPAAAAHFETGCAVCHGSPAAKRPPIGLAMLPPAPDLAHVVGSWSNEELFEIVKHGVRYTGMPAWPSQSRADEVWALVALLREMPSMNADQYRELAGAPPAGRGATIEARIAYCDSCHAADRQVGNSVVPILSGQSEAYLLASLQAYHDGDRPSGIMETAVSTVDDTDFSELAAHYARQGAVPASVSATDPAVLRHGETLAVSGDPARKIPACAACHGTGRSNPLFPRLDGLSSRYLASQLRLFVSGERGGTAYHHIMAAAVQDLEEADIDALAAYYAHLPDRQ